MAISTVSAAAKAESAMTDKLLAVARRVETLIGKISSTEDPSQVFDLEQRALEALLLLHSPDRERLHERICNAVDARLSDKQRVEEISNQIEARYEERMNGDFDDDDEKEFKGERR
jgi:hypothetical protein